MPETKKCTKCGRELPVSEFYRAPKSPDGYRYDCKTCCKEYYKAHYGAHACSQPVNDAAAPSVIVDENGSTKYKVFAVPELARFTPKQLIQELRARGYRGELTYIMKVKI